MFTPSKIFSIICILYIAALAVVGFVWPEILQTKNELSQYYELKYEVSGQIVGEPDIRADKILLTVGELQINHQSVPGKILVQTDRYPEYEYGLQLTFTGKIEEPSESPEFSYKNYLSRFGIFAVVYRPKNIVTEFAYGNHIKYYSLTAKRIFNGGLDSILPEPENGFLKGILTGQKAALPQTIIDQFNTTGTSHVVAVSGFNITIIVTAIGVALNRFGRRISLIVSTILILLFVILTGASASVVRAGIMGLIGQLAINTGRLYYATNALLLAAVIMLIQNPKLLHFDVGFQLSFLALGGLVYISPLFEKYFPNAPGVIKSFLFPTLSAQIMSTPFILLVFGRLSLIAPLTNLIVLPFIPVVMAVGFAAGLTSIIFLPAARLIGWVAWIILHAILKVIGISSGLPLAAISFQKFPPEIVWSYYLILIALLIVYYHPKLKERLWNRKPNA